MTEKKIAAGVIHIVSAGMEKALSSDPKILAKWNDLTPIQRNEWICWTTIVKKTETRTEHIERLVAELKEGERQPCCWPGCPHRRPSAKKWFKKIAMAKLHKKLAPNVRRSNGRFSKIIPTG